MWQKYPFFITLLALIAAQDRQQFNDNTVKNGTANAHWLSPSYGFSPYAMPFAAAPVPFPPMPPPMLAPIPAMPFPSPMTFPPLPPLPPLLPLPPLDPSVCTLDATVLVVLNRRVRAPLPIPMLNSNTMFRPPITPIGASRDKRDAETEKQKADPEVGIMPPCLPGFPGTCGNAVRIRCAETAVADILTCTTCCRLANKLDIFPPEAVHGVLIDSAQLIKTPTETVGANIRKKRLAPVLSTISDLPPAPPSCASMNTPCPALKCMCCGPRLPFPQISPFLPPVPPPMPFGPVPAPVPFGPMPPPFTFPPPLPFGPTPFSGLGFGALPSPMGTGLPPMFPMTGQANPAAAANQASPVK